MHGLKEGRHPTSPPQGGGGWGFPKAIPLHGGCTIAAPGCIVLEVSTGVGICHPMAVELCGGKSGGKAGTPTSSSSPAPCGVVTLMFAITPSLGDCLCPRAAGSCPPSTRLGDAVGSSHCPPSSLPGGDSHAQSQLIFPSPSPLGIPAARLSLRGAF